MMAQGGIAALRYDDGGNVQQPEAPVYSNDDNGNLVDSSGAVVASAEARKDPYINTVAGDPTEMQALFDLKSQDPKQFYSQVANKLGKQIIEKYQANDNYDNEYTQLQSLKDISPADYYKNQLGFKAHSMGWQVGQNRGERNAPTQQEIESMIPEAQKAGLAPEEIGSLINTNFGQARNQNVQRIATLAANGGSGFNFQKDLQPMLIGVGGAALGAGAFGPLMAAATEGIGALGAATEIGAAGAAGAEIAGGAGAAGEAGITGLTGAADAASATSNFANSLPSLKDVYQGYKLANNLYGVAQSGGKNIGADIGAARGIYSAAAPMMAAQGGLMNGGGIANLGSYSDGGQLLKGPGDGMSDNIPAKIGQHQPARLADGEFVIPADVVSHLGNGSTDAGAKHLYKMMDRIRRARTGNPKQGKKINPDKYLPRE
jgi:hypothetical protein